MSPSACSGKCSHSEVQLSGHKEKGAPPHQAPAHMSRSGTPLSRERPAQVIGLSRQKKSWGEEVLAQLR